MENVTLSINLVDGRNFLSLTADISEKELERLTKETRLFLGQTNTSELALVNIPVSHLK